MQVIPLQVLSAFFGVSGFFASQTLPRELPPAGVITTGIDLLRVSYFPLPMLVLRNLHQKITDAPREPPPSGVITMVVNLRV